MKTRTNKGINPTNGHNVNNWTAYGKSEIPKENKIPERKHETILTGGKLPKIEGNRNRIMATKRFFAEIQARNKPMTQSIVGLSSYSC